MWFFKNISDSQFIDILWLLGFIFWWDKPSLLQDYQCTSLRCSLYTFVVSFFRFNSLFRISFCVKNEVGIQHYFPPKRLVPDVYLNIHLVSHYTEVYLYQKLHPHLSWESISELYFVSFSSLLFSREEKNYFNDCTLYCLNIWKMTHDLV